jgi:hypothetical protein
MKTLLMITMALALQAATACEQPCKCVGDVCSNCNGTTATSPPPTSDAGDAGAD